MTRAVNVKGSVVATLLLSEGWTRL